MLVLGGSGDSRAGSTVVVGAALADDRHGSDGNLASSHDVVVTYEDALADPEAFRARARALADGAVRSRAPGRRRARK